MLEIKSLEHVYNESSRIVYPDWEVHKGNHSLILGNSGSGKTTLLHIIGGLLNPNKGNVLVDNTDITTLNQSALDNFRGANIGIVFQQSHLISSLSVSENLILSQYLGKKKIDHEAVHTMMEQLDIVDLKTRKAHQISQGQSQRVSIARALLNKPKLLLADEPTANLDDKNCEKVIQLLKEQAELCQSTLIVATHDHRIKSKLLNALEL
jgi:putative ABC transport system ATP-binding protein